MGLFSSGLIFKGNFVLVIRWAYFAGGLIFPYRNFTVYIMKFQNNVFNMAFILWVTNGILIYEMTNLTKNGQFSTPKINFTFKFTFSGTF